MLEFKLDPHYFLSPSADNWPLLCDIIGSLLDNSLRCQVLQCASSCINTDRVLKPLWKCMREDPLFKEHARGIVQEWALILSDKDELVRYDPEHSFLMPVVPPKKPRDDCSFPEHMEDEDHALLSKLFTVLKVNGMPIVHKLVRKAKEFCPIFKDHASILTNLCLFYKQQKGFDIDDSDIPTLFSYFSKINFVWDKDSLQKMKSLPLFKNIDGKYCSLHGEVFVYPEHICREGIFKLLQETTAVFLAEDGEWCKFSADTLGVTTISPMCMYVKYLFPYFHLLSDEERLNQLVHIRDTGELFKTAVECSKMDSGILCHIAKEFLQGLQNLPVLMKNGRLMCISEFVDPRKPVFELFLGNSDALPEKFREEEWLSFFEEIGLQLQPSQEQFVSFCSTLSDGHYQDVQLASTALLECLFEVHEWHKDKKFLHQIRTIPFVCVETPPEYTMISSSGTSALRDVKTKDGTCVKLACLEKCALFKHAHLVWTLRPVVCLPPLTFPPIAIFLQRDSRRLYEEVFNKNVGVMTKPSASDVLKNMYNLSRLQRFSNFKLFHCYSEESNVLVDVVAKGLEFINKKYQEDQSRIQVVLSKFSSLCDSPCIPVCSDVITSNTLKPVLVKPLQVVCNLTEELRESLHPFLCCAPKEIKCFTNVLGDIGVNANVKLSNVFYALNLIHMHAETPLDHKVAKSVMELLKLLYRLLSFDYSNEDFGGVLYLPSHDRKLVDSTQLIYNDRDKMLYRRENYDFASLPSWSVVSLLCDDEITEYGFQLSDLISKLPSYACPIPLSKYCDEKLHGSCKIQGSLSQFANELQKAIKGKNFTEVVKCAVYIKNPSEREACAKFVESLQSLIESLEVRTVLNLKVDVEFRNPLCSIGTAAVSFLLLKNHEGRYVLYVDTDPMMYRVHDAVVECLLKELWRVSHTDLVMDSVKEVMGVVLSGASVDTIKAVLTAHRIDSSMVNLESEFNYADISPEIGAHVPEELHHRLMSGINNRFRSQELVGYKIEKDSFIFALVEYQVVSADDKPDEYYISTDEYTQKRVCVLDLYKLLCARKIDGGELELYDPTPGVVELWDSIREKTIEDIARMILVELEKICKLQDGDKKQKAIEAMYLRWYPDKSNHPLATKAFQFLLKQIERIKNGLGMEELGEVVDVVNFPRVDEFEDTVRLGESGWERERHSLDKREGFCNVTGYADSILQCQALPDKKLAAVWIAQAKYDMRAVKVMKSASEEPKEKLHAHVCFLAHQAAEKTLKAGMYAFVGLSNHDLHKHYLVKHAKVLERIPVVKENLNTDYSLSKLADVLEPYFLSCRYPNRCIVDGREHDPSSSRYFELPQSKEAAENCERIFDVVCEAVEKAI